MEACSASLLRYPLGVTDPRDVLATAAVRYRATEAAHAEARQAMIDAVRAALRAGVTPTEVERLSPFTGAYIRKLAREGGIPAASPGPKPASSGGHGHRR